MNINSVRKLPTAELLALTQTNITPDASEGFEIAKIAYESAETQIDKGIAARQAGFRAEQANIEPEVVQYWFNKSRDSLAGTDSQTQRELVATELLIGRALALRLERLGKSALDLATVASDAFKRGEVVLQQQHKKSQRWDRYGTMLARHRATHEAMNGNTRFAATTALRGLWRAVRAEQNGTPEKHSLFVVKQLGMNAASGLLAVSKPLDRTPKVATARHKLAMRLLG